MKTFKFIIAALVLTTVLASCTEEEVKPAPLNNGNVTTEENKGQW